MLKGRGWQAGKGSCFHANSQLSAIHGCGIEPCGFAVAIAVELQANNDALRWVALGFTTGAHGVLGRIIFQIHIRCGSMAH